MIDLAVGASQDENSEIGEGAVYVLQMDRLLPDFGDAPDAAHGVGKGNYQTTAADGGPSHLIVAGLFLGNSVDGDNGALQNKTANADDVDGLFLDDEDGVLSPVDLLGTVGASPTVTLLATNTTGSPATLSGWIDYNHNGQFDNGTERAQVVVPTGTTDGQFTLTFPTIPTGSAGTTYARFRLSTDAAAGHSTGAASDGEVEDYQVTIGFGSSGPSVTNVLVGNAIWSAAYKALIPVRRSKRISNPAWRGSNQDASLG